MSSKTLFKALTRKKTLSNAGESQLSRCLTLIDLTALGVGSTLGLGVYMLAGKVAKDFAGPAACLSFLIAAIASAFAGVCYAEFASRVPKAGSAYVYSYVSVGEFIAYIIGWNLILEYAIGTASVASGMSGYIDYITGNKISAHLNATMGMNVSFLADYPDFLSLSFVIILTGILSIGVKESTRINNVFTSLNLLTISIIIVTGAINAHSAYWTMDLEDVPVEFRPDAGNGGFAPFGVAGIMAGAAQSFFGFVGFDAVATTGEEAQNPQRNIPLAIVISLSIIFLTYFAISTVLTMMSPYYDQHLDAPFLYVFDKVGWYAVTYIVSTGAIIALCSSMLGAMFPLPRVIYAMANDGVIFKRLAVINAKTQTPLVATIVSGSLVGIMTVIFNTDQLMDMMSIGTLLAYSIVAICVLILRYQNNPEGCYYLEKNDMGAGEGLVSMVFNLKRRKFPTEQTSLLANWLIGFFCLTVTIFDALVIYAIDYFDKPYVIVPVALVGIVLLLIIFGISRQPVDNEKLSFSVPWVPLLPCASVLVNFYLMLELDGMTWIRFVVWLVIGFVIYFSYGIKNSEERKLRERLDGEKNEKLEN